MNNVKLVAGDLGTEEPKHPLPPLALAGVVLLAVLGLHLDAVLLYTARKGFVRDLAEAQAIPGSILFRLPLTSAGAGRRHLPEDPVLLLPLARLEVDLALLEVTPELEHPLAKHGQVLPPVRGAQVHRVDVREHLGLGVPDVDPDGGGPLVLPGEGRRLGLLELEGEAPLPDAVAAAAPGVVVVRVRVRVDVVCAVVGQAVVVGAPAADGKVLEAGRVEVHDARVGAVLGAVEGELEGYRLVVDGGVVDDWLEYRRERPGFRVRVLAFDCDRVWSATKWCACGARFRHVGGNLLKSFKSGMNCSLLSFASTSSIAFCFAERFVARLVLELSFGKDSSAFLFCPPLGGFLPFS